MPNDILFSISAMCVCVRYFCVVYYRVGQTDVANIFSSEGHEAENIRNDIRNDSVVVVW